ncbi:MAG: NAD(P)H-quinone oxidoreductase [Gemmatimonadetes bacterium]|nr:NAD(P)H-quinone oxidoreductase [Gemmatimonadota bacterium]
MRAVVITRPGGPEVLAVREVPTPEPSRGEVRVRVHAAGVNRADLLQRRGVYPAPAGWPQDIPGLEYAGVVDAVGEGLTRWNVGARVMGIVGGGGYAEYVVVHEREAIAVPEGLSLHEAAAIPEVFITAHDALFTQLGLAVGERLLIHAVGSGVGTAALQLTKAAGVFVFGTSRSAWKLERARALGLDVAIDVSREDFATVVARETRGEGVHAILDLVGAPYLQRNLEALAVKGRMIVVGLTAGNSGPIELGVLLRKRLRVVGTSLRTRTLDEKITAAQRFEGEVVPQFAAGRVKPVVDAVFPMERASEAHRRMEENANFGKIVMQTRPG